MPAGVDPEYARRIGQAIAASRRARGLTQEQLRLRIGNSKNAVSNWERGVSVPTIQNLRELCRALQVSPERLMVLNGTRRREEPTQFTAEARVLAARLATLRETTELAAPDLIGALREAELEARRLATLE
jgi:transcriptional regulator with XRE-family HTH domain